MTFKPGSARNFSYGHGGELECISYCLFEPGDQAPEKHQQDFEGGSLAGPLERMSGACHAVFLSCRSCRHWGNAAFTASVLVLIVVVIVLASLIGRTRRMALVVPKPAVDAVLGQ